MSAPDERDVEALTTLLTNPQGLAGGEVFQRVAVRQAHRILASDWYAERIADALRECAERFAATVAEAYAETEPELHTDEAPAVIAAELVACTLGQRSRPELMPDDGDVWEWAIANPVQAVAAVRARQAARVRGEGIEPPTRAV